MKNIAVIAGMPRSATTFLYYTLGDHPDFFVPARKELEFFSLNYPRSEQWYWNFFSAMSSKDVGFDISPMYFFDESSADRIRHFFSNPRVVVIVRRPIEFALSFYKNRIASGNALLSFSDFLSDFQYVKDRRSLTVHLAPGFLHTNLDRFASALGDNLLLVDYRSIQDNPLTTLQMIESFVGAQSYFEPSTFSNTRINASNQLNFKVINRLMHSRWFSDLVTAVVPKRLIMAVRLRIQSTARASGGLLDSRKEAEYSRLAERHFTPDNDYYENLFRTYPFVLGSGRAFSDSTNPNHRAAART